MRRRPLNNCPHPLGFDPDKQNEVIEKLKKLPLIRNRIHSEDFQYEHDNPYYDKLLDFSHFVLQDKEPEKYKGHWNQLFFKREAPLHLEIGTGFGDFMLDFLPQNEGVNFVGMDYKFKRGHLLAQRLSEIKNHSHYALLRCNGERLNFLFDSNEVDSLYLFFPDPWPKNRHLKKRIVQNSFIYTVLNILKPGGKFFIKTDHLGYYFWMIEFLKDFPQFIWHLSTENLYETDKGHPLTHFQTKFEKIFIKQNNPIKAIILEKK